ncbi:alpha/beta hydrolase [Thermocrispum sp.]|uniref:Alpha/beta hydrolase n=1 Tax=Thermocrispum agreste TaxID=37925 RepID=A0A2W4JGP2_9PSEU|nr:alpha/beta hydrolase [Thermocrispum sp.]PZM98210.1 MAG: alpha/beta hydrolase [Thermocrispum agreste]
MSQPPARLAVLLPGSGSDEVFLREAFGPAMAAAGVELRPHRPGAPVVTDYLRALDAAAEETNGRLLVGGVSLGAHVAVQWAASRPGGCTGILACLPAYIGRDDSAPAALAARTSADLIRAYGLSRALELATRDVPYWLAAELKRAWRRQSDVLLDGLGAAARHPGPKRDELARVAVPAGLVGCVGDAVHPVDVARQWQELMPKAALVEISFDRFGGDRAILGHAAVRALAKAAADGDGPAQA